MKATKQQQILCGVLVLGAIAIGLDQFVFRAAPAQAPTTDATAEFAIAPAARTENTPIVPVISVSQRLRNAGNDSSDNTLRDAFAMGPSWRADGRGFASDSTASPQAFRQTHHLSGVMISNGRSLAMVDQKIVTVGQMVDGFKLTEIANGEAVFTAGSTKVVLSTNQNTMASGQ